MNTEEAKKIAKILRESIEADKAKTPIQRAKEEYARVNQIECESDQKLLEWIVHEKDKRDKYDHERWQERCPLHDEISRLKTQLKCAEATNNVLMDTFKVSLQDRVDIGELIARIVTLETLWAEALKEDISGPSQFKMHLHDGVDKVYIPWWLSDRVRYEMKQDRCLISVK